MLISEDGDPDTATAVEDMAALWKTDTVIEDDTGIGAAPRSVRLLRAAANDEDASEAPDDHGHMPNRAPSALDDYARVPSLWGDGDELVPGSTPVEVSTVVEDRATAPPSSIDEPDPDDPVSIGDRIRDFFARAAEHRARILIGVGAVVVVAVVIVGGSVSMRGNRGKPPEPAGAVPAASDTDNTPEQSKDSALIPSKVDASCGIESDPVAPFVTQQGPYRPRAWVCDRYNLIDGSILNIFFDKTVIITKICVVPGWNSVTPDGKDEWGRHRLTTALTWRMGGNAYPEVIPNPTRTGICWNYNGIITDMMSLTITGSARPPMGEDQKQSGGKDDNADQVDQTTAIGSIVITGRPYANDGTAPAGGGS